MEFVESIPKTVTKARSEEWIERVRIMKENPGKMANVGEYSPAVATHIRSGMYRAFLPDDMTDVVDRSDYMDEHWEVHTRSLNGSRKKVNIFISWLG